MWSKSPSCVTFVRIARFPTNRNTCSVQWPDNHKLTGVSRSMKQQKYKITIMNTVNTAFNLADIKNGWREGGGGDRGGWRDRGIWRTLGNFGRKQYFPYHFHGEELILHKILFKEVLDPLVKPSDLRFRIRYIHASNDRRLTTRDQERQHSKDPDERENETVLCSIFTHDPLVQPFDQVTSQNNTACGTRDNHHSGKDACICRICAKLRL